MISIIVPIYNTAPYLRRCLDSLIAQSLTDWEAVLIDDCSADDSVQIAHEYEQLDHRFLLLKQPVNQGQSAARNRGLDAAHGEYIVFVDADDWLDPDFLAQHMAHISGHDYVQSGYRRCATHDEQCTIIEQKTPGHRWQFTSACMRLYRRQIVDRLRFEEGTFYEDVLWTVDVLNRHPRVAMIPYIGYNYRLNPQSTTSVKHNEDRHRVLRSLRRRGLSAATIYTYLRLSAYFLLHR